MTKLLIEHGVWKSRDDLYFLVNYQHKNFESVYIVVCIYV